MIDEERVRRERLQRLYDRGQNPYPAKTIRTHTAKAFLDTFETVQTATLTGRIRLLRRHGGLTFLQVEDGTGTSQWILKKDLVGEENYEAFHETVDVGDFLEGEGGPFTTQKGERSLLLNRTVVIAKSLLPLPEKWHGLSDQEMRYRHREMDLIASPEVRDIFRVRGKIVSTMRRVLDAHGFLEVETPVLQYTPGGASARPFKTHHEALHADMYLRIAPELFLKRLLVGGFERVYEVARCFRNEGIDHAHNPEFTQIEGYAAYMDYEEQMDFLEGMIRDVIVETGKNPAAITYREHELNFAHPWKRLTFAEAFTEFAELDLSKLSTEDALHAELKRHNLSPEPGASRGTLLDQLYKELVRPHIVQPTYLYDYPADMSPLVKRKEGHPEIIEMFQLVVGGGMENIKAFSELNDPVDQEARFAEQDAARRAGDTEAQWGDHDYVRAMKQGMPPNSGFGIGIDRLTALLTNAQNLKEVILFPTLRPQEGEGV